MQQSRPKSRFIVRARNEDSALSELTLFLATLEGDLQVELVDKIGPAERPHTAVVEVSPEQVPAFEQRVRNSPELMIEPDSPLWLSPSQDA